jgi:hypothetical protein
LYFSYYFAICIVRGGVINAVALVRCNPFMFFCERVFRPNRNGNSMATSLASVRISRIVFDRPKQLGDENLP